MSATTGSATSPKGTAVPHRSAAGAEVHMLLDEIARLRAIEYDAQMAELPQVGER